MKIIPKTTIIAPITLLTILFLSFKNTMASITDKIVFEARIGAI